MRFGAGRLLDAVLAASALTSRDSSERPSEEDEDTAANAMTACRELCGNRLVAVAALVGAGAAAAADIGANDDTGKYAADGGAVFFPQMAALGLQQSVMTMRFMPSDPTTIHERRRSRSRRPARRRSPGFASSLAVYPYPPRELEDGSRDAGRRSASSRPTLARRYPTVKQFVVGNEPNQPAFLRPQFDGSGMNVVGATAGELPRRRRTTR